MRISDMQEYSVQTIVDTMRQHGITSLSCPHFSITISDKPSIAPPTADSKWEDESLADICSCEHNKHEHNDFGECLFGCLNCKEEK